MGDNKLKVEVNGDAQGLFTVLTQAGDAINSFSTNVTGSFSGVADVVTRFQKPLLETAAVLGGGSLFKSAIEGATAFSREVGGLQRLMGGTTQEASVTAVAVRSVFGDVEGYEGAAAKLVKTLNKNEAAVTGLGVKTRDAQGHFRGMNELLPEVVQSLSRFKEGTDRDAAAQALFGRSFKEVLVYANMTPEVMEEARKKAQEFGLELDAQSQGTIKGYRKAMVDVQEAMVGLKTRVSLEVMPSLTQMANWFTSVAPGAISAVGGVLRTVTGLLSNFAVQVTLAAMVLRTTLAPALNSVINLWKQFIDTIRIQMALGLKDGVTGIRGLVGALQSMINPWVVAGAAIFAAAYGLSTWAQSYSKASAEAAEGNQRLAQTAAEAAPKFHQQGESLADLEKKLNSASKGSKAHEEATLGIQKTLRSMAATYPEFLDYLHRENGQYVDLAGSVERFNKAKVRQLELQLEEEKRKAQEASSDKNDALGRNIVSYALVYKGVAENAEKEKTAHEATAKAIQQQIDAMKGLVDEDVKHWDAAGGKGAETQLEKLKNALEQEKYLYEKNAYDHGQLLEYSKDQEAKWLKENVGKYALNAKERNEVEKMGFEASRAAMRTHHEEEMRDMKTSLDQFKANKAEQLRIAEEYAAKAANPKEAAEARAMRAKIQQDIQTEEKKVQEIELDQKKAHAAAILELEEQEDQRLYQAGVISEETMLQRTRSSENRKFELEESALKKKLDLAGLEPPERARINAQIEALEDKHASKMAEIQFKMANAEKKNDWKGGWIKGLRQFVTQGTNLFQAFANSASRIMNGVQSTLSNTIQGLLTGSTKAGDILKTVWSGVSGVVVQVLSDLVAQYVTTAIAQKVFAVSTEESAEAQTAAQTQQAAAETWTAYAGIPYVGAALALAQIALMEGSIQEAGMPITAFAAGGVIDRPTHALISEIPGSREIVTPETTFRDWATTTGNAAFALGANMAARERQIQAYQGNAPAVAAPSGPLRSSGSEGATLHLHMENSTILDSSSRGLQMLGNHVIDALQEVTRRRGGRIKPGLVFGGI